MAQKFTMQDLQKSLSSANEKEKKAATAAESVKKLEVTLKSAEQILNNNSAAFATAEE